MNSFFNFPASLVRFTPRTTAKAEDVNARLDEVTYGFDQVDAYFRRVSLAPVGETMPALPALADRRNKSATWGANGEWVPTVAATSAEMQAAIVAAGEAATSAATAATAATSVQNSISYIQQLMLVQGVR